MAIPISNVGSSTDTFQNWLEKTNLLLDSLSTKVVTTEANTSGGVTSGNAFVSGILSANILTAAASLRGGTVDSPAVLPITSNVSVSNTTVTFLSILSNTSTSVLNTGVDEAIFDNSNTNIQGGHLTISSNIDIVTSTVNIDVSVMSIEGNVQFIDPLTVGVLTGANTTITGFLNVESNATFSAVLNANNIESNSASITTANITTANITTADIATGNFTTANIATSLQVGTTTVNSSSINTTANVVANTITASAIGIGTEPGPAGTLRATGDITAHYSDERLKNIIGPIPNALEKISYLTGFYFKENSVARELGYSYEGQQVGVSAQKVEEVLPEVVKPAPINDQYLTVQYEKLVPLLIEGIKELDNKVKELIQKLEENGTKS